MNANEDEHSIEAIGRCRVVVRNGRVADVGKPIVADCRRKNGLHFPCRRSLPMRSGQTLKPDRAFGMCTAEREIPDTRHYVGFGAAELISSGIQSGIPDAAVLACDGAGTVVATTPEMVQGIGGRMSGLVSTSPHPSVMNRIEQKWRLHSR